MSAEPSTPAPPAAAQMTKVAIVDWVNSTLGTSFGCIKDIPAKAAAVLLHAMLGADTCSLANIQFADASSEAARLQNCKEVLLTMAPAAGYTGGLTPAAWLQASMFSELLKFWRWVYGLHVDHPLPPSMPASLAVLQPSSTKHAALLAEGAPQSAASGGLRSSDMLVFDDAALPVAAPFPTPMDTHVLAPGKENKKCQHCSGFLTKSMQRDAKRLRVLQQAHTELLRAIADRDLDRVTAVVETL